MIFIKENLRYDYTNRCKNAGMLTNKVITEGVNTMCNLSQGIWENAERKGRLEGRAQGQAERETRLITTMYRKGYTLEQIADVIETSVGAVKDVLAKEGL